MTVKGITKKSTRARSAAVSIETLEIRCMMSKTMDMDGDLTVRQFHEAPPAIVEYVDPATTQNAGDNNGSLPVDPTTNQANNSRSLGIYDCTFGTEPGSLGSSLNTRSVYWPGLGAWNGAQSGVLDMGRERVEKIAKISRDGGKAIHTLWNIKPGSLTVLDFETPTLEQRSPQFVADRLRWFKAAAPTVPVGVYGYVMYKDQNRQTLARFNADDQARFDRDVLARRAVIDAADFIMLDAYMLGPGGEERDLAALKNLANGFHRLFPNKPVVSFVWGAYHTTWNPDNSVFSDEVTERYVQMCRESFDGVIVWGPAADNQKLFASLQRPGNAIIPSYRVPTFASEPTNLNPGGSMPSGVTLPGDSGDESVIP